MSVSSCFSNVTAYAEYTGLADMTTSVAAWPKQRSRRLISMQRRIEFRKVAAKVDRNTAISFGNAP